MSALRVVLIGKNGQIGWELERVLSSMADVRAYGRSELDLSNPSQIRDRIREACPNIIVNAAAYTAVDRAETETEAAVQINAVAPGIMAEEARRLDAMLVHYSTDYVFDGAKSRPYVETDAVSPLGAYGRSKLAGELAVQAGGCSYVIFRTSWVYGARGHNFLLTILRLARSGKELRIVDDQCGAPTWSRTVAEVTAAVLRSPHSTGKVEFREIFHLSARGVTTWRGFAQAALDQLGWPVPIAPVSTAEYGAAAPRPLNSALCTDKLTGMFSITLPEWKTALGEVLKELKADTNSLDPVQQKMR